MKNRIKEIIESELLNGNVLLDEQIDRVARTILLEFGKKTEDTQINENADDYVYDEYSEGWNAGLQHLIEDLREEGKII